MFELNLVSASRLAALTFDIIREKSHKVIHSQLDFIHYFLKSYEAHKIADKIENVCVFEAVIEISMCAFKINNETASDLVYCYWLLRSSS